MKIGQQITIGFLVVITIFIIFAYSIYLNEKSIETATSYFSDKIVVKLNTFQELKVSVLTASSSTLEIILLMDERGYVKEKQLETEIEIEKKRFFNAIRNFENAFEIMQDLSANEQQELDTLNKIKERWDVFLRVNEELIKVKASGVVSIEIIELKEKFESAETNMLKIIDEALEDQFDLIIKTGRIIDFSFASNFQIILVGIVLVVITSIIIGLSISRSISKPITMLKDASRQVIAGNLEIKIQNNPHNEIGELMESFNVMTESIKEKIEVEKNLATEKEKVKNERLTAIGELAGRLAHDLRNPLSIIKNDLEMITEKNENTISSVELDRITRATERMTHQIEKVMDFVREKPINLEYHAFSEIIMSVLSMIKIPNNIKIDFTETDIKILCDIREIEILFYNLILNSIQEIGDKEGQVTIRIRETKEQTEIEIEDSGSGIPPEYLDKIFDPLFTTKQIGTGLGLASCINVIKQLGGTISVQNNPTKFIIIFPKKD